MYKICIMFLIRFIILFVLGKINIFHYIYVTFVHILIFVKLSIVFDHLGIKKAREIVINR